MITRELVLHEVGPRDGLQFEEQTVPTEQKLKWIHGLLECGLDIVQVGSFVHPARVPQMADADLLFSELKNHRSKHSNVTLSGLVLNEKGLERGLACGVDMFCMGVSASETHSRKNTGMSIAEASGRIIAMADQAEREKKKVQVSVQSAFGCGYEGEISMDRVLGLVGKFLEAGHKTISLADTAGHATPDKVEKLFNAVASLDSEAEWACHFHNTYGLALANCYAAYQMGVRYFESSFAGLGGCPFTKIAGGNVCTEDLVHMLQRMNVRKEVNLGKLIEIARDVGRFFGRDMAGYVHKSGPIPEFG